MKNTNFLLMAMVAVLAVFAISCTPSRELSDYDYDQRPVYNTSPYGNNVIVVERDPYTGRYYQVSPNGSYRYDPYYSNRSYDSRYYDSRYNTYNRPSYRYNNRSYDSRVYNNNTATPVPTQPSQEQKQSAKDKVFGKRS